MGWLKTKWANAAFTRAFIHGVLMSSAVISPVTYANTSFYDQMIIEARNGNYIPFLDYLKVLEKSQPLEIAQRADAIQISNWAARDHEAVRLWREAPDTASLPERAVVAAAHSYRNIKQWDASLKLWQRAMKISPKNENYRQAWIMTLADANRTQLALAETNKFFNNNQYDRAYRLKAYIYQRQGNLWDVLFASSKAVQISPDDSNRTQLVHTLNQNNVNEPALRISRSLNLPAPERKKIAANAAARLVRLSNSSSREESARYHISTNALLRYDKFMRSSATDKTDLTLYWRVQIDRLGALSAQNDDKGVIHAWETEIHGHHPLPLYARQWVADAYLTDKHPDKAYEILQPEITSANDEISLQLKFYVLMDNNKFDEAKALLDRADKKTPYLVHYLGLPASQPNDAWLTLQQLHVDYFVAVDKLPEAEALASKMAETAPGNQGLRIGYASVLQARERPREAEKQLKIAEIAEPSNLELERQQASVARELQEWQQADLLTEDAVKRDSRSPSTQRLVREQNINRMSELRISIEHGIASDSPVSGSHDGTYKTAIYSPPVDHNLRLFGGFNYTTGQFEEGTGINRDVFGGAEWRSRDNWGELELSNNYFNRDNKLGARLSASHDFNDRWQVGGGVERFSQNTPLRALRNGVTANSASGWIRWQQNERRQYKASLSSSWFSDNNHRYEYGFEGREFIWQRPRLSVYAVPAVSGSTNSESNVSYYNPAKDFFATTIFELNHTLYRYATTTWSQQFVAGGGMGWQEDYGTAPVISLGYGQRIQMNSVFDVGGTLKGEKRSYDGTPEWDLSIALDANLRF